MPEVPRHIEKIETEEAKEKYGCNTRLRAIFVRHAQKMSGEVFSGEKGISLSLISEKGEAEAEVSGEKIKPAKAGYKGFVSPIERTEATFNAIEKGYTKLGEAGKRFKTRLRLELDAGPSGEMEKIYSRKFDENRVKLLTQRGLELEEFKKLLSDEQEEIAEAAEEPVIEEWLFDKESKMHKISPPEDAAAKIAQVVWRYVRMPDRFYSKSEVNIFNATHKTTTEPLLKEILVLEDGQKMKSLKDIGGSLGTLDSWELDIRNDREGSKTVKLLFKRKRRDETGKLRFEETEYGVDLKRLEELAKRGVVLKKEEK